MFLSQIGVIVLAPLKSPSSPSFTPSLCNLLDTVEQFHVGPDNAHLLPVNSLPRFIGFEAQLKQEIRHNLSHVLGSAYGFMRPVLALKPCRVFLGKYVD